VPPKTLREEKNGQILCMQDENNELRERLEALEAAVARLTTD